MGTASTRSAVTTTQTTGAFEVGILFGLRSKDEMY